MNTRVYDIWNYICPNIVDKIIKDFGRDNAGFALITVSQSPAFPTSKNFHPLYILSIFQGAYPCLSLSSTVLFALTSVTPPSSPWHHAHATCHRRGNHAQRPGDAHWNLPSSPRSSTAWKMHRCVRSSWPFETPQIQHCGIQCCHVWSSLIIISFCLLSHVFE